jgi:hypothetical protein
MFKRTPDVILKHLLIFKIEKIQRWSNMYFVSSFQFWKVTGIANLLMAGGKKNSWQFKNICFNNKKNIYQGSIVTLAGLKKIALNFVIQNNLKTCTAVSWLYHCKS